MATHRIAQCSEFDMVAFGPFMGMRLSIYVAENVFFIFVLTPVARESFVVIPVRVNSVDCGIYLRNSQFLFTFSSSTKNRRRKRAFKLTISSGIKTQISLVLPRGDGYILSQLTGHSYNCSSL